MRLEQQDVRLYAVLHLIGDQGTARGRLRVSRQHVGDFCNLLGPSPVVEILSYFD